MEVREMCDCSPYDGCHGTGIHCPQRGCDCEDCTYDALAGVKEA
jgi:hypothetical protein